MPLPLAHITMEAIAKVVENWRKSQISSPEAIRKIGSYTIAYQKVEWEEDHK